MAQPTPLPIRVPTVHRTAPSNLPAQLTSFVGREQERDQIACLLRDPATTRLVTLTGVGGVGKTRLALEVAADLIHDFADGVWLVELASVFEPRRVLPTIAATLGIHDEPNRDLADTLQAALGFRHLLLVLDNCEHLVDACADAAYRLLSSTRKLALLTTSREPLNVSGETTWQVRSLAHPSPAEHRPSDELLGFGAVQLFVDRTSAACRDFELSPRTAPGIAQICYRLDGLPLALELAAARVPALGLDEVALRLDDRFRLLAGGSRSAPPRQQTLRAVVEWSFDLLSDDERRVFAALSVFSGGWRLDAAEAICDADIDVLARLVDKSLMVVEDAPLGTWYRMLETVRAFAAERLRLSGHADELRTRHLAWYANLSERGEHVLRRDPGLSWDQRIVYVKRTAQELDNLRAACQWSIEGGDTEAGLRLAGCLFPFFYSQTQVREGREWLDDVLRASDGKRPSSARATALSAASKLAAHHGDDVATQRYVDEYQSLPEDVRSTRTAADVLSALSILVLRRGSVAEARAYASTAVDFARQNDDAINVGMYLIHVGAATVADSAFDEAERVYTEALEIFRATDFSLGAAQALTGLATVARALSDFVRARRLYGEAADIVVGIGAPIQEGQVHLGLGAVALEERDYPEAQRQFAAAAQVLEAVGQRQLLATALEGLAVVARSSDPRSSANVRPLLSARELQVARLVALGRTNREIAAELVISIRTADRHVENILTKLEMRSRGAIAAWAAQQGLLEPQPAH